MSPTIPASISTWGSGGITPTVSWVVISSPASLVAPCPQMDRGRPAFGRSGAVGTDSGLALVLGLAAALQPGGREVAPPAHRSATRQFDAARDKPLCIPT